MKIQPCTPEHLHQIVPQPRQATASAAIDEAVRALSMGQGWALLDETGPRAAAGFCPDSEGSAWAWAVIGLIGPRGMVALHRAVKRALEVAPYRHVVTLVDPAWPQAVRWARMLGMSCWGPSPVAAHDYWGRGRG